MGAQVSPFCSFGASASVGSASSAGSAGSASFLTPIATPVDLMVMGPAGYKFGDYWKLGLPLMMLFFLVAVFLVPIIWPF